MNPDSQSKSATQPSGNSNAAAPKSSAPRRGPLRRVAAQPKRLEDVDDSLGPLGPLGDNAPVPQTEQPPVPPQKEQTVTINTRQGFAAPQGSAGRGTGDSADLDEDEERNLGPRIPPPVQPAQGGPARRDTQPSVSIEQAAKPSFDISVGDPHKVGDLTSSHIVYQVHTKVSL